MSRLSEIQQKLNIPKSKFNKFGGYKYRSAEDILAGLKPLLGDAELVITDECVELCQRVYVKATACLTAGDKSWLAVGWAREANERKGMDAPQLTGTASSYARKYAMQALFLLDNESDPDSMAPPANDEDSRSGGPPLQPEHNRGAVGPTPWDPPIQESEPGPPPQGPPPQAPPGKIAAPTSDQRKWLSILWDWYQTQSPTKLDQKGKTKLLKLLYLNLNRYPGSVSDVEQAKKWIKVSELQ